MQPPAPHEILMRYFLLGVHFLPASHAQFMPSPLPARASSGCCSFSTVAFSAVQYECVQRACVEYAEMQKMAFKLCSEPTEHHKSDSAVSRQQKKRRNHKQRETKRETRGRQERDKRETRERQERDKRETRERERYQTQTHTH